ncbi:AraC family transcriptional regulator [Marinobacterium arenosum]|uniref:AraC family transcriptional regulator n=1 Tax=Marinobacterium arenosum TaxID=2862496 RepID=UPI001C938BE8|nr:AraC family transcriptional regulator [Marinobacterium arenosum]MBY4677329.1 AraC family transcriptional regulator [Marinobacterium arenosum]
MGIERYSISGHFARALVDAARRRGLDCSEVIRQAQLNEDLLQSPQVRITPDQFSRLMVGLWHLSDDEFLCMGSRPSRFGIYTLMTKQVIHAANLRAVFRRSSHFYNLVADAVELHFEEQAGKARLTLTLTDPSRDPDHALCEFLLLIWHRFPSWLIGQPIPLSRVELSYPKPAHVGEYRLMFPCPAHFDQPTNCLEFDSQILNAPVIQTPQTLRSYLKRTPLDWFRQQAYYPVFTRRVMDMLQNGSDPQALRMEAVAAELHVTTRTLCRKLTDEGTSFQQLKDSVRRDAAIHALSQRDQTIAEIARQLGFTEPAAFTRAFKHWTGVSPRVYRSQAASHGKS